MAKKIFARECINFLMLGFSIAILVSFCQATSTCRNTCPGTPHRIRPSVFTEQRSVTLIKCHLRCVRRYYENSQLLISFPYWPTYNATALDQNCYVSSKVEQCTEGCVKQAENPHLKPKQCRNICFSECTSSCRGSQSCTISYLPCQRKCKKPVCRTGCGLGQRLDVGGPLPVSPRVAPVLIPLKNRTLGIFQVAMPSNETGRNASSVQQQTAVNFLFRVVDPSENISLYFWQTDLFQELNLQAFSCRHVEVSFAVVTNASVSQFSPAASTCISDPSRLPSQVTNYTVQYSEDSRVDYTGYAAVTLSWTKPIGHSKVTSYSFYVASQSSKCGGYLKLYQFNNIQANATQVTIKAPRKSGFLKFGCSYLAILRAHPAPGESSGTHLELVPSLDDQRPYLKLQCSSKYQANGTFQVKLEWSVAPSVRDLQAIQEFQLLRHVSHNTSKEIVSRKDNKFNYTFIETIEANKVTPNHTYTFLVRPLQNQRYNWRPVPVEASCNVATTPNQPPSQVNNVSVVGYQLVQQNMIKFTTIWNALTEFVTNYKIIITNGTEHIANEQIILANQTTADIELHLKNVTGHCLYLKVIATRWSQDSIASDALVLPRDTLCVNSSVDYNFKNTSGDEEGRITVWYKSEASSKKVFDIGCSGVDQSSFDGLEKRLASIEDRLARLSHSLGTRTANGSLTDRLNSLNQKLDTILTRLESSNGR